MTWPSTEVSCWVASDQATLWRLVSDIALLPRLSKELQSVMWIPPAYGPSLGASFIGVSRLGEQQWSTVSHIVEHTLLRVFSWAVGDEVEPNSVWSFRLEPTGQGTTVTQSVQIGPGPSGIRTAMQNQPHLATSILAERLAQFQRGMESNLAAVKAMAEADPVGPLRGMRADS